MDVTSAEHVGRKDEGSVEYTNEQRLFVVVVALEFGGHALHLFGNFFSRDEGLKGESVVSNFAHVLIFLKKSCANLVKKVATSKRK